MSLRTKVEMNASSSVTHAVALSFPGVKELLAAALDKFEDAILAWVAENAEQVIFQKKLLFYTVRIRVRDIAPVFEALLGDKKPKELSL